jgi:hypothetical protein
MNGVCCLPRCRCTWLLLMLLGVFCFVVGLFCHVVLLPVCNMVIWSYHHHRPHVCVCVLPYYHHYLHRPTSYSRRHLFTIRAFTRPTPSFSPHRIRWSGLHVFSCTQDPAMCLIGWGIPVHVAGPQSSPNFSNHPLHCIHAVTGRIRLGAWNQFIKDHRGPYSGTVQTRRCTVYNIYIY